MRLCSDKPNYSKIFKYKRLLRYSCYLNWFCYWSVSEAISTWSLTPPFKCNGEARMLSLEQSIWNRKDTMGFVRTSASWSWVEMKETVKALVATLSRTKWKSISTFLVQVWNTGLADMYAASMLLHQRVRAHVSVTRRSWRRYWIHCNLAAVLVSALYSASVVDRDIVGCLQELQEIKFFLRKIQYALVEWRPSGQQAQSASEKASRCWVDDLVMRSPWDNVCLRYCSLHLTTC